MRPFIFVGLSRFFRRGFRPWGLRRPIAVGAVALVLWALLRPKEAPAQAPVPALAPPAFRLLVLSETRLPGGQNDFFLSTDCVPRPAGGVWVYGQNHWDTTGVVFRRLRARGSGPFAWRAARGNALAGTQLHYRQRYRHELTVSDYSPLGKEARWQYLRLGVAYPQVLAGPWPARVQHRLNAEWQARYFQDNLSKLAVVLSEEPQPTYDSLTVAQRRARTDTVTLYELRVREMAQLNLAGLGPVLSLSYQETGCAASPPPCDCSATAWAPHSDLYLLQTGELFQMQSDEPRTVPFTPDLAKLLSQVVLQDVRQERLHHHQPPLTAEETRQFEENFWAFQDFQFTRYGLYMRYCAPNNSSIYGLPLPANPLPASRALLVPYALAAKFWP